MGKSKSFKIELEDKLPRKGHTEHRSGSGEHDNRPRRVRTRQKEEENWREDEDVYNLIDNCIL